MNTATHLRLAALSGFVAVAIGAFAAHGLKGRLPPAMFDVLQTAVQYQFYHSLAWLLVLVLALRSAPSLWLRLSARCFGAGILLFSGSLYVLALGGIHRFGMVTPLGGAAFLLGWLSLAIAAGSLVSRPSSDSVGR